MNQKIIDDLIKIAGENIDEYPEAARWITEQAATGMADDDKPKASKLPELYSVMVNNGSELRAVCPSKTALDYSYPTPIRSDGLFEKVEDAHYTFAQWEELSQ